MEVTVSFLGTICPKHACDVTFTRTWGIFRKLNQPVRNANTRLILGFGHHDASQWWLNVCLHQLCTKLRRVYLVLGHIIYVYDTVCWTCRCLGGIRRLLHIVSSVLCRVLRHVKFQTEYADQQLDRWLVATYQLPHWDYEDKMALHALEPYMRLSTSCWSTTTPYLWFSLLVGLWLGVGTWHKLIAMVISITVRVFTSFSAMVIPH